MQKSNTLIPLFLLLMFFGCSESISDLNTKDVTIQVSDEHLNIENHFNHSIYYFAVESETAALLNWRALSTEENRIRPNRTKLVSFDDIYAFEKGSKIAIEKGDEIAVYYWSEKEPSLNNIKFQSIETN